MSVTAPGGQRGVTTIGGPQQWGRGDRERHGARHVAGSRGALRQGVLGAVAIEINVKGVSKAIDGELGAGAGRGPWGVGGKKLASDKRGLPFGPIGDSTPHSRSDANPMGRKDRADINKIGPHWWN